MSRSGGGAALRGRGGRLAQRRARSLAASDPKAELLIHIGRSYRLLADASGDGAPALEAVASFEDAAQAATAVGARRSESFALGYLGELYESEGRTADALVLTRRAIAAAQADGASEAAGDAVMDPLLAAATVATRRFAAARARFRASMERARETPETFDASGAGGPFARPSRPSPSPRKTSEESLRRSAAPIPPETLANRFRRASASREACLCLCLSSAPSPG